MDAKVRVMRSFDYCHFEVELSSECADIDAVNALRKEAAVLVDEAVRQYKVAKKHEAKRDVKSYEMDTAKARHDFLKSKSKSELTVDEAAALRSFEDDTFWKSYRDDDYFYEDHERDYHLSMLAKFKESRVKLN